jgi:hypothetical protein
MRSKRARNAEALRLRAALALAGLLALAGCGSTGSSSGDPNVAGDGSGFATALLYGGRTFSEPPPQARREYSCPKVEILDGTVAYRSGDAGSARGVAYQASINDFARECSLPTLEQIRIKVGVQGRVILGENGRPGTYNVPVRVAVRRGSETVHSRLASVSVTIAGTDAQAPFVAIDETILLPVGTNDPGDEYTILIGLDPQGTRTARPRRR